MNAERLRERRDEAMSMLRRCGLCPRNCGADRLSGEKGFCKAGADPHVASVSIHNGEEPPISGTMGSGTVFFSYCNMSCLFCQNYPLSQMGVGAAMTAQELGDRLIGLQEKGAHNVNFVTPTPHAPQLIGALLFARERGFTLPVVYNTNGYDSLETLRLMDGVVEIYLPDMKYLSEDTAELASGTRDYPARNLEAVAEMLRQVGPLAVGQDGVATRGVLIRHLVLPGRVEETEGILALIRERFGAGTPLSLMGQYFPAHRAAEIPEFGRRLTKREYGRALLAAERLHLTNVFIQEI